METSPTGETKVSFRIDNDTETHTRVSVFIGDNPGSRGHAGQLIIRTKELKQLSENGKLKLEGEISGTSYH